ncbi:transcriptional regulator, TetR family [[Actinomadura] parvosata subsp. kistnae]|uniref:TetR family transcriptional regulator n=1 Tax=[Actinomadura] parvosata subsp. kistnae TaxID=1909395 RepID=A0A1U9ZU39_9ACTN|nr:TetR/AcrR family transcriptional regulator [Nonomuraea sp. ATCC 55076]AQZ61466.1 TetR family transcriptional regulator [Nonomuraea sp. ATCC 55076]SPL98166.1 transcriptional regulator, TetR family [Actinomadura parvosata subsp. kistnae]
MSRDPRLHPRKQPRQVRAELTRRRILEAAAQVFTEYGYAAGTTNRIAEYAGVSIGSLYQYYPNKDAILLELMLAHLDSGEEEATRRQTGELPGTAEGLMRLFVQAAIANHLEDPRLLRVMVEQAPRSPELLQRVYQFKNERNAHTRDLLRRYREVRVSDLETAARIINATIELVVHQVVAEHEPIDLQRLEDELVAMFTRYLTA